ncbi:flagellar biosynthetic protein FliO [Duganella qianjiadongensis]|uniref:Flagellar protein n=1 Tax=Duganella qianjiadongensis TaxID=2692176 RepID=A0ABW9VFY6_9BURK|nr:flagellar biosynthetic protein FliO [Duganella qianjiadongensis]MYM38426.1 flagellar biosynthetic protein FliO [Duganella qianjiadongensis]
MKRGLTYSLLIAAALAAAPAIAQHRVSGTIGGQHSASASAHAAAAPPSAAAPAAASPAGDAASAAAPAASTSPASATTAITATAASAGAVQAAAPAGPLAMTIPTPAPAPASSGGGMVQTTMALLFVLAVLVGLAWLLKRFGPKHLTGNQRHIKLVDSLNLGARERILLLEVGEQWIVVGASAGRMNALTTLPRQELPPEEDDSDTPARPNFAAWLKQTIEQRHGK